MERDRSISSVIMMASLGPASSGLRRRVESRFSKHPITFRKRMPSVNGSSEVCDASVSITCSSCMRSNSSGYSTLMYATSTEPGRIKGSSSRFPSRKLDRHQKITHVARSSPSRSWVVYIMTTAEAHEFFRERCDCLRHGRNTSEKSFTLVVLLRASRQVLVVFLDEENKQERHTCHVSELLPGRARMFSQT